MGAFCADGVTTFTVWAPEREAVDLIVEDGAGSALSVRPLQRDERGYWSGAFRDIGAGARYRYRLDRAEDRTFPDPASRFQPLGVHGPSQVVDPATFEWTDAAWRVDPLERLVIYELHVGTFTPAGTFAAAIERLPHLARLGVTAIELMPIADFAGDYNWGYDGVALFAPARCYGTPDSLRRLVDAAHRHGLAVILDVVYNHFGPDGAYATVFSPHYFSDRHRSPWGRGINFDGPHSAEVRRFFIENARQWIRDYHVDGLRLDATHAIVDESTPHFLAELTSALRADTGRDVILTAEDHRNLAQMMMPVGSGGWGLDAVWADDFHHQVRVHTARDRDGYYADFSGTTHDIAETLTQGWFFRGQYSSHLDQARGTDPSPLDPPRFVICIQNHDQVGNRVDGSRLHHDIDPAAFRALSALLLLAPHTPLLFMGQEWATTSPFQFFTDHHDELGRQITKGRRAEFASFEAFGDDEVPDPQARETFERSHVNWDELSAMPHAGILRLYERLLDLRRSHPAMRAHDRRSFAVRAVDGHTLWLRRSAPDVAEAVVAIVRLSGEGPSRVQVQATGARELLTTEDVTFVDTSKPIHRDGSSIQFDRPGAVVLAIDSRCHRP
jgi:maltooligosyltrehalose trehalohydrolase